MNRSTLFKALIISYLVLIATFAEAQTSSDSFQLSLTIEGATVFATADNLGQVYRLSAANVVEKYTPDGRLLTRYSNNRNGRAAMVDVTNPLKTVVWYYDFRTVVFLDRNLTELGELSLLQAGFPEVRTVASTRDGNLWIYDEVVFRLRKITPEGRVLFESPNLAQIYPEKLNIVWMEESDNQLFALEPNLGLLLFDAFAQPLLLYVLQAVPERIDARLDRVLYPSGDKRYEEDIRIGKTASATLPVSPEPEGRWQLAENQLFFLGKERLYVFRR